MKNFKDLIGKRIRYRVYDLSGGLCLDRRRIITNVEDDGCTINITAGKLDYGCFFHNDIEELLKNGKVFTPFKQELKIM